jgi:glucose uptake protein GlcU
LWNAFIKGLWGIFWFKEIRGLRAIILWLASAVLTVGGVLLLSYEHGSS